MPPLLLRLMLCLCLVLDPVASAWAATAMAAPADPAHACHEMGGAGMAAMAGMDMPMDGHTHAAAGHCQDQARPDGHGPCCKAGLCGDCLQHGSALSLWVPWPRLLRLPATPPGWRLHEGPGEPVPDQPIRPPIG